MSDFRTVADSADVAPGKMTVVEMDGDEVAIANVGGEFFAFSNTCPHADGPLGEGELKGEVVTCPWHFTPFNVRTGEAQEGGVTDDPVPVYKARVEDGKVQVKKP